jgi:plastocyanin
LTTDIESENGKKIQEKSNQNSRNGSTTMRFRPLCYALSLLPFATFVPAPAWAVNHTVDVSNFAFSPQTLMIGAGDTVTFINSGGFHNVESEPGSVTSFRCANGCDGDGMGGVGDASGTLWSATVTFPAVGTIGYFCEIHGGPGVGMFGTISVIVPVSLQSFDIE